MHDLTMELEKLRQTLRANINMLQQNGRALAEREHEYQVIKAQTVLRMKDAGCTITEINMSIKGQPKVADALLERDIAKVLYDANMEQINAVKLDLRLIENQIAREWSSNG